MYDKVTQRDIERMQEEVEYRKLVVRPEAIASVQEARAHGDLSENFEYKAAKQYKNQNDSRIRYLERMIKTAQVISEDSAEDEVGLNNTVDIYYEDDDEVETYKITTTVKGNSIEGKISIDSPLGKAVMGHKVGDRVEVKLDNGGSFFVEIRRIVNTEDDGTDQLRSF